VPNDLSGVFQVVPILDTGPIPSRLQPLEIRLERGQWIRQK
jgi:hypothetical protein